MSENDVKKASIKEEEVASLRAELEQVKEELVKAQELNNQYEAAYKEQMEKYNRLFGLFANNIDYYILGQKQGK